MSTPAAEPASLPMNWIRPQFPALAQTMNGHPIAFLDGPGGTQVPRRMIDAMRGYLAHSNANAHGAFITSHRTDEVIAASVLGFAFFL